VPGAGRKIELLRAPDRSGREIFIHAGLELDVVLIEVFSRSDQLLVITAKRRPPRARDKARSVEAVGAVAPDLGHRQANQRLNAGQEDVAGALGVLLIEVDRTLVDSHSTLLPPSWAMALSHGHKSRPIWLFLANHTSRQRHSMSVFAGPASQIWACRQNAIS
jgi:hypothetical protein